MMRCSIVTIKFLTRGMALILKFQRGIKPMKRFIVEATCRTYLRTIIEAENLAEAQRIVREGEIDGGEFEEFASDWVTHCDYIEEAT